jgi:type III pantothenate kinase
VLAEIKWIAIASVWSAGADERFTLAVNRYFEREIHFASTSRVLAGVECAYADEKKLGVDRWLAVVAAYQHYQSPVCVVDCGSALTIDMVNSAGRHLGGYILPGLNMSVRALLGQTQSVRFTSESFQAKLEAGVNTSEAVQNGALLLQTGAVKEAWVRFLQYLDSRNEQHDQARLVLTGGDAALVTHWLGLPFEQFDDLVLRGLRLAFDKM